MVIPVKGVEKLPKVPDSKYRKGITVCMLNHGRVVLI